MIYFTPGDIEQMKRTEIEERFIRELEAFIAIKCHEFTKETGVGIKKVDIDVHYNEELTNGPEH